MAKEPRRLKVVLSRGAVASLRYIWAWNAEKYGDGHADKYIAFLALATLKLETEYHIGKQVPSRAGRFYVTFRKSSRGHGHVVVFQLEDDSVFVLNYFHTAQNWLPRAQQD